MKDRLEKIFPHAGLLPGAEKLIRHLHKHRVPIAVATGSDHWGFSRKTAAHKELFSLFHHCVCSSDDPDVKHGKPAPDCFLICAKRFPDNPDPSKVLVLEDAPNGVEAGLKAGMQVVWVPDPRADRSQLADRVDQVLDSLEHFEPEKFGLPAFGSS
ncbi:pseudouridine-5'-phosphatase [Plakobranchus ocellatus]|uniref:Pseudouridine-5'-phosphatase n=1 Tax=Plakobranchus ocellatus TaxID=259542 RepID=A0AAV4BBM8_9GAST|nr:pseudouridine-5'-phosphatase [Plakobranchus ocellatus]